jgi:hypothetical protein
MNIAMRVRAAIYALLIGGLVSPCAMAVDAATRGEHGEQGIEATHRPTPDGSAVRSSDDSSKTREPGPSSVGGRLGARLGPASRGAGLTALHGRSPLSTTEAVRSRPGVGASARGNLLRKLPASNHLAKESDPATASATARATAGATAAVPMARAVGAVPSAGATRQPNGVLGVTRQGAASLKASAGNGVIGGAHTSDRSVLGGPINNRTAIRATIDGSAFHRR